MTIMLRKAFYILIGMGLMLAILMYMAQAQTKHSIYTGGETGAYNSLFCPPLMPALEGAYFYGYECTQSRGTLDNIDQVLANPTDIGFAQLDVYSVEAKKRPEDFAKLTVVRQLACEGIWLVTKNQQIDSYAAVLAFARRIPFLLPPEQSGSAATFKNIQALDPEGLGRARNITYTTGTSDMLTQVAASAQGEVGMFVQFGSPKNDNIKFIAENDLKVLPIVSRDMMREEVDGQRIYQAQEFELESGFFSGKSITATCTPAVIFTGNPEAMTNPADASDQRDLIEALKTVPSEDLLPKDGAIAKLMKAAKRLSDKAVEEMIAATEKAKEALQ